MLHDAPVPRSSHLDAVRTALVAWVIAGHALLGYTAVGGWAYDEVREVTFAPATELALVAVIGPTGLFVIGVFFFVSGLLTEAAVGRHGTGRAAAPGPRAVTDHAGRLWSRPVHGRHSPR